MRRLSFVLIMVAALTLTFGGLALADHATPVGGCPDGFELHHIGTDGNNHVHIDNNVPCDPKPERCVIVEHDM